MNRLSSFLRRVAFVAAFLVSGGELAGAQGTYPGSPEPWYQTANVNLFVDGSAGNDNNSGLAAGSGNAWATFAPVNKFLCYRTNGNGFPATIAVANASSIVGAGGIGGAFQLTCTPPGYTFIVLNLGGGTLTPASGFDAILLYGSMQGNGFLTPALHIANGTITCSGGGAGVHVVSGDAVIENTGGAVTFGTCTGGAHVFADGNHARIFLNSGYTIGGNAAFHLAAVAGGLIDYNTAATITCTGSPAFTSFVNSSMLGIVYTPTGTIAFSGCGTATGKRFQADTNGLINTNTAGVNTTFYPGNAAGTVTSQGLYN